MERNRSRRIDVDSPLAPVRLSPVRVNGTAVTQQGVELQRDDGSWQAINIHSAEYHLVPNAVAEEVARRALRESGLAWSQMDEVWTGRYWARLYKAETAVEVAQVGDALSLGLRVENSYDGSCQFRLVLMAYVLSCSNGLVCPEHFARYTMRHTRNNEFRTAEAARVLRSGMEQVKAMIPLVSALSEVPLTVELMSRVSREVGLPKREWGFIIPELRDATSAWDLMQAITHQLTHHGRGKAGLLYQEQVGDYFFSRVAS